MEGVGSTGEARRYDPGLSMLQGVTKRLGLSHFGSLNRL